LRLWSDEPIRLDTIGLALTLARETTPRQPVDLNLEGATCTRACSSRPAPVVGRRPSRHSPTPVRRRFSRPSLCFLASALLKDRASLNPALNRIRALLGTFDYVVAHAAELYMEMVALSAGYSMVLFWCWKLGKRSPDG
jgi:hypothetical protein